MGPLLCGHREDVAELLGAVREVLLRQDGATAVVEALEVLGAEVDPLLRLVLPAPVADAVVGVLGVVVAQQLLALRLGDEAGGEDVGLGDFARDHVDLALGECLAVGCPRRRAEERGVVAVQRQLEDPVALDAALLRVVLQHLVPDVWWGHLVVAPEVLGLGHAAVLEHQHCVAHERVLDVPAHRLERGLVSLGVEAFRALHDLAADLELAVEAEPDAVGERARDSEDEPDADEREQSDVPH